MRNIGTKICVSLLVLVSYTIGDFSTALAFDSQYHAGITITGLYPFNLSCDALRIINNADVGQDIVPTFTDFLHDRDKLGTAFQVGHFLRDPFFLFGNFANLTGYNDANRVAFIESTTYIDDQKQEALAELQQSQVKNSLKTIGRALHAVQDMFAHTNFVDLGRSKQQLLWNALFDPSVANITGLVSQDVFGGGFNDKGNYTLTDIHTKFWVAGCFFPDCDPLGDPYPHGHFLPIGFNKDNPNTEESQKPVFGMPPDFLIDPSFSTRVIYTTFDQARFDAIEATHEFMNRIQMMLSDDQWKMLANYHEDRQIPCTDYPDALLATEFVTIVGSTDPNAKIGPQGAGTARYLAANQPLQYEILFENQETATAPAQEVVITDQLDMTVVDLTTFSLGPISFGDKVLAVPPGLSDYTTDVDLRPAMNLIVRIAAHLDTTTGLLTWHFTSIDPVTGQLTTDPLGGFLPPNKNPPEGVGGVLYTVMPKQGLSSGSQISNQATIVFDTNSPMNTPVWHNTFDYTKPTSHVHSLPPTEASTNFIVEWSGSDDTSGIKGYNVFVSENGSPYALWQLNTEVTSATFLGQRGKTYSFYSTATDQAGNQEDIHTSADAVTQVIGDMNGNLSGDVNGDGVINQADLDRLDQAIQKKGTIPLNPAEFNRADVAKKCGVNTPKELKKDRSAIAGYIKALKKFNDLIAKGKHPKPVKIKDQCHSGKLIGQPLGIGLIDVVSKFLPLSTSNSDKVRMQVFDLAGASRFDSGLVDSATLSMMVQKIDSQFANGVYLYVLTTKRKDDTILRSEVKKLIILR
ncbi:hypothetical protein HYR54_00940 [Candidatus Acetothermia bacterium]|nr:hypothetical protein [Candidatus Acetothermia bacterium]